MLRSNAKLLFYLSWTSDVALAAGVFVLAVSMPELRQDPLQSDSILALLIPGLVASLAWPAVLEPLGLYSSQRRRKLSEVLVRLAGGAAVIACVVGVAVSIAAAPVASSFAVVLAAGQLLALSAVRIAIYGVLRLLRRQGRNYRNVLIVGSGARARQVVRVVERHPEWGLRVAAFIDDGDLPQDPRIPSEKTFKLVDLPRIFRDQVIDEVVVACPRSMLAEIGPVVATCATAGVPVTVLSDLFGDYMPAPQITRFGSLAALNFAPVHHSSSMLLIKRGIDVIGASLLLLATLPIVGVAALLVRASSPGPIFFKQLRCGQNSRQFRMIKLRSMYIDAEARKAELLAQNEMDGPVFKMKDDPRVTPIGRLLRRWSIDELPQFWNVLVGEMSLVGPRPPVPMEVAEYETFDRRRLSMRPGITCLWQVNGRNGIGFEDWVNLDLEYIDTWSLLSDLKILLKTIPATLRGTGS